MAKNRRERIRQTGFTTEFAADALLGNAPPPVVIQEQMNIITRDARQHLEIEGCVATSAGLDIPDDISREQMENLADILFYLSGRTQLFIGDMLVASERLGYGDIKAIAEQMDREGKTLSNWKSVCKSVTTSLRKEVHAEFPEVKPLSMGHYNLIQAMDEGGQRDWMRVALREGLSVAELRNAIQDSRQMADKETVDYFINWQKSGVKKLRSQLATMTKQERRTLRDIILSVFDDYE